MISLDMQLTLGEISAELLTEKALFLPAFSALVIADLHFGKVNHFRRSGLPVPSAVNKKNAERLIDLVNSKKPQRTIFLGDLFHSHYNDDWEVVGQIVNNFSSCKFELVRGNHDILSEQQYRRQGITVTERDEVGPFILTHEPLERGVIPEGHINLAGHLHPGARLVGKGRQSLMFSCFWCSENQIVLPAFGSFTGLAAVRPIELDRVYIIIEGKIIEITHEQKQRRQQILP